MLGEEKRRDEIEKERRKQEKEQRKREGKGKRKKNKGKFLDWESCENWRGRVEVMLMLMRKKEDVRHRPIERGKMM